MAEKRSSKTARVLNLITQQGGETPEQNTEEVRQPADVTQEEKKVVKRKAARKLRSLASRLYRRK